MAVVITVAPTSPGIGSSPTVTGTGLGNYKTRLLLDGVLEATICPLTDGTFSTKITVGSTVTTQTLETQQLSTGAWHTVDSQSVSVVASNIYSFSSSSASDFVTICGDTNFDVIEIGAATYHGWRALDLPDRSAFPLTIRPAAAAAVVFDAAGDGDYGDRCFGLLGAGGYTFDGSTGSMTFQHYLLAQDGIFLLQNAVGNTITDVAFHNIAANFRSNGQSSHLFYISHGVSDLTLTNITGSLMRSSDESGGTANANGIHIYTAGSGAAVTDVTITDVAISNAGWGIVLRNSASAITVTNLDTVSCGLGSVPAAIDFGSGNTGTYTNCSSTTSIGTGLIQGSMTDGGGNGPFG